MGTARGAQLEKKYCRKPTKSYECVCPTCERQHTVKSFQPQHRSIYCKDHQHNRNMSEEGYPYIGAQR